MALTDAKRLTLLSIRSSLHRPLKIYQKKEPTHSGKNWHTQNINVSDVPDVSGTKNGTLSDAIFVKGLHVAMSPR